MRLTLRTLLAYLDDILEPAETREIGRKVSETPFAQELSDRIRDVVRRRRLMAPTLEGPEVGLDPNTVSEYLDNQLTPAQVAQTERVFLESDVHLAEVASAHQILTLVQGELIEVLPNSRERMYALGPVPRGDSLNVPATEAAAVAAPEPVSPPSLPAAPADSTDGPSLTDYVREQNRERRLAPFIVLAMLAGLWLFLHFTGSDNGGGTMVADNGDAASARPEPTATGPVVTRPETETATPVDIPPPPTTAASGDATGTVPDGMDAPGIDPPPPADEPEIAATEPGAMDAPNDTPPLPEVVESNGATDGTDAGTGDAADAAGDAAADDALVRTRLRYRSLSGVLVQQQETTGIWLVVAPDMSLKAADRFAVPVPFTAEFEPANYPLRVTFGADSRARFLGRTAETPFGFELEEGRVVIERVEAAVAQDEAIRVALVVAERQWLIELPAGDARVGVEAATVPPVRLEKTIDGFGHRVSVVGSRGEVVVKEAGEEDRVVRSGDRIALAGPDPDTTLADPGTPLESLVSQDPAADWIAGPTTPTGRRYAGMFQDEFDPMDPVGEGMLPLVTNRRPWMSQRAVQCLAVIQHHTALVRALNQAEHDEALDAAIAGLRAWLPSDPDNGERLRKALSQEFNSADNDAIYRLLWGFDEDDARDPTTSQELVDWLMHEKMIVRKLAYFHITRLTGQQDEYRSNLSAERRSAFHKRWQRTLDRNGSLLQGE